MTSTTTDHSVRAPRIRAHKAQTNEREWDETELEILRKEYPIGGFARVSRRLTNRTKSSIYSMAHELKVQIRPAATTPQRLDSATIAQGLRVDPAVVLEWIHTQGLKATLRDGKFIITTAALRRWIGEHPKLITLSQVDPTWFLAMAFPPGRTR